MPGKSNADTEGAHNKGQEDASKGEYDPPTNIFTEIFSDKNDHAESEAYKDGWRHTHDQQNG
jgi:hypothetical protein